MRVLGLIPVRGGSKGIPHKNKKLLNGKPLMEYTIAAALEATQLDAVICSSEDAELRAIASKLGVEVPFVRPESLAQDTSGSLGVVRHALQELEKVGKHFDAVCLLQVTNPFRSAAFIDQAITKFKKETPDALISVLKVPHEYNPHWVFEQNTKGFLDIATGEQEIIKRRQELPEAFIRDGAIYITKTEVIREKKSLYGNTLSYIISDPEHHVNIDTMDDWVKAEAIAKKLQA